MANKPRLMWGDVRQVMVTGVPGMRFLPCMPMPGSIHAIGEIPNGTFITFVRSMHLGAGEDSEMWVVAFTDKPSVEVLITPAAYTNGFLWKAVRPRKIARR